MNRNNEKFINNPVIEKPRSSFAFNSENITTFNAGQLIPVYRADVLPGDTWTGDIHSTIRMSSPLFPTMDNCYVDTFAFFVPNRLCWNRWTEFMGENPRSNWTHDSQDLHVPSIVWNKANEPYPVDSDGDIIDKSVGGICDHFDWTPIDKSTGQPMTNYNNPQFSLLDYFGLPIVNMRDNRDAVNHYEKTNTFSMLPFEAYNLIWNNFFRDCNSIEPIPLRLQNTSYSDTHAVDGYYMESNAETFRQPYDVFWQGQNYSYLDVKSACKFHDSFTSALPQAQKGAPVPLPGFNDGSLYPVGYGEYHATDTNFSGNAKGLGIHFAPSYNLPVSGKIKNTVLDVDGSVRALTSDNTSTLLDGKMYCDNLWTRMDSNNPPNINDLRYAFAIQRILENDARAGNLYGDLIYAHFGVENPDARLQLPEYLGGSRQMIDMQQVVQTSETDTTAQGNVAGLSLTNSFNGEIQKSFTEHGQLIVLAVIRPVQKYQCGIEKDWSRRDRYDFYTPELANIGEQPIKNKEICCGNAGGILTGSSTVWNDDDAFGFNEPWYDYRYKNSNITGLMRSGISDSLDSYHYGEFYHRVDPDIGFEDDSWIFPVLSPNFLLQTPYTIDRSLTFNHEVEPQFIGNFSFKFDVSRTMPVHGVPGLVDHY